MLDTNCNIGWHFYRNYFNDISLDKEYLKKDEVEALFKGKNDAIAGAEFQLVDFSTPLSNCAFRLKTVYPGLLLGSGYGHETGGKGEFKLGFFFEHTTGLPLIPGSSLKGAIRSAFPNWERDKKTPDEIKEVKTRWIASLIRNTKMETVEFSEALKNEIHTIEQTVFDGIRDNNAKKPAGKYYSIYERNIFFDAFIVERGKDKKILGTDSITPHGDNPLRNPTPLPFLKVLPRIVFEFRFRLNNTGILSIEQMERLFKRILLEKGVGAKTNIGYGQFVPAKPGNNPSGLKAGTGKHQADAVVEILVDNPGLKGKDISHLTGDVEGVVVKKEGKLLTVELKGYVNQIIIKKGGGFQEGDTVTVTRTVNTDEWKIKLN